LFHIGLAPIKLKASWISSLKLLILQVTDFLSSFAALENGCRISLSAILRTQLKSLRPKSVPDDFVSSWGDDWKSENSGSSLLSSWGRTAEPGIYNKKKLDFGSTFGRLEDRESGDDKWWKEFLSQIMLQQIPQP
jgi:hypothetical protein